MTCTAEGKELTDPKGASKVIVQEVAKGCSAAGSGRLTGDLRGCFFFAFPE